MNRRKFRNQTSEFRCKFGFNDKLRYGLHLRYLAISMFKAFLRIL